MTKKDAAMATKIESSSEGMPSHRPREKNDISTVSLHILRYFHHVFRSLLQTEIRLLFTFSYN